MSDLIRNLNAKGVYELYVYDALLCEEKDSKLVADTMNWIILEHGVKTSVKFDGLTSITDRESLNKSN